MAVRVRGSRPLGSKVLNSICMFLMNKEGLDSFDVDCLGPKTYS